MTPNDIAEMHKRMEWQKAKGHLEAMKETFHSEGDREKTEAFEDMVERIDAFVKDVEDNL